jgi:hypothetical protein
LGNQERYWAERIILPAPTLGTEVYAMAEPRKRSALSDFADSPFTWGGISLLVGAALVSPAWFRAAFIGAGVAIGIGIVRAFLFGNLSVYWRCFRTLALLLCLGYGWFRLWGAVPKPVEPATPDQIADAVVRKLGSGAKNTAVAATPGSASATIIANAIVNKLPRGVLSAVHSPDDLSLMSHDRFLEVLKADAKEARQLASNWSNLNFDRKKRETDWRDFTKIPVIPNFQANDCPLTRTSSYPCRQPNDAEIADHHKLVEQETAKADQETRDKARGFIKRACSLPAEILTDRLEQWEAKDVQPDNRFKDLCAHIDTVNYGSDDVYRVADYLDKLQTKLETTSRR